jgi:hypothetical protein
MRVLQEIFAEVVDKNARVADNGRILDPRGNVVKDYARGGLPAYLEFELDAGAEYFTLDVNGTRVHQPLRDGVRVAAGTAPSVPAPPPVAPPVAPPPPAVPPAAKSKPKEEEEDANAEWKGLPLEFGPNAGGTEAPDVHLEEQHEEEQ